MLKTTFKYVLQKVLGFELYLFVLARITIERMRLQIFNREFKYFVKMIPEDGIILDLGSNIGITAVPLAKRVARGKVFCFEPIPVHVKTLKRIIAFYHLSNIEIFATALGVEPGKINMVMPVKHHVKYQGYSHVAAIESGKKEGDLYRVSVYPLDDFSEIRLLPRINAIKIDVENFEYQVFQGAKEIINQFKPIIYCELWDDDKKLPTIEYMQNSFGYRVKVFKNNGLTDFKNQQASNFFFIPPGSNYL